MISGVGAAKKLSNLSNVQSHFDAINNFMHCSVNHLCFFFFFKFSSFQLKSLPARINQLKLTIAIISITLLRAINCIRSIKNAYLLSTDSCKSVFNVFERKISELEAFSKSFVCTFDEFLSCLMATT